MGEGRGQVLIEVLLMLPIFLLLVFTVMEIGHLAFRTILLHHAAYEVARVGSLTAYPVAASPFCRAPALNAGAMNGVRRKILARSQGDYRAMPHRFDDPQDGCRNYDLVVTLVDDVPMIFPMTGLLLSNEQRVGGVVVGRRRESRGFRRLTATVRMPIERPLFGGRS